MSYIASGGATFVGFIPLWYFSPSQKVETQRRNKEWPEHDNYA